MSWQLYDMHCHLDAFDEPEALAAALAQKGIALLAVTVTPQRFAQTQHLAQNPNVRLGVGMHPWYFDERDTLANTEAAIELSRTTRFVGEVGLDFYERHAPQTTWEAQRSTLERILDACASTSTQEAPTIISLHAVRSASAVLDLIEHTGCNERCACIFHWFGGSTDELWRAIQMGCWFSCNEKMMGIKRSKEYAKLIPENRLLLETDYPPEGIHKEVDAWADDVERSLLATAEALAAARGTSSTQICELSSKNAAELLQI